MIEKLQNTLNEFNSYLESLKGLNLVIGGSWALRLHGLILEKEPNDVDIVIYRPTPEQLTFLDSISMEQDEIRDDDHYEERSYKFTRNGFTIDFLLETERELPEIILSYNLHLYVNSIEEILRARSRYMRDKDILDTDSLKKLNLNLTFKK